MRRRPGKAPAVRPVSGVGQKAAPQLLRPRRRGGGGAGVPQLADVQLAETALAGGWGRCAVLAPVRGSPTATVHSRTASRCSATAPTPAHQYAAAAASRPGETLARIIALDLAAYAGPSAPAKRIRSSSVVPAGQQTMS
ncbi:hypothetical protein [Streptomyces griseofuscus]|uniref:hypothetical protein n=1 Tax=Streptomyces griseofuscus TaxID=146922 RepID=UPI000F6491CD|nr:hypothetical protein [Streptomyces griseofuscus]